MSDRPTPSRRRPPRLRRRSRISDSIPSPTSESTLALDLRRGRPVEDLDRGRTRPHPPAAVAKGTALSWITARVSSKGMTRSTPWRRTPIRTLVPGLPLRSCATWSVVHPTTDSPSTSTIRSPGRSPARYPGVPGTGARTVTKPSRELDLDSHAAVFAPRADLHVFPIRRLQEGGVGIAQRLDHTGEGGVVELLHVDLVHEVAARSGFTTSSRTRTCT